MKFDLRSNPLNAIVSIGDEVEILVENGRIVITPVRSQPRAGWADDAKRLAEEGDDASVWPDFPNEADIDLKW